MCRGGSRELFSPLPTSTSSASSLLIHQCFSEPQKVNKDNPLVLSYSSATSKRKAPLSGLLSLVLISSHSSESRSSRRTPSASLPLPSQSLESACPLSCLLCCPYPDRQKRHTPVCASQPVSGPPGSSPLLHFQAPSDSRGGEQHPALADFLRSVPQQSMISVHSPPTLVSSPALLTS